MGATGRVVSAQVGAKYRVQGTNRVVRGLAEFGRHTIREMKKQINQSTDKVWGDMRDRAPVATGELLRGITQDRVRQRGITGKLAISTAGHSAAVEYGTWKEPPTAVKPPPFGARAPLTAWVRSTGQAGLTSGAVAWALARGKGQKVGTPAQPFAGPAAKAERRPFFAAVERILFRDAPRHAFRHARKRTRRR